MLAEAANHYIAMGENRAVKELKLLEDSTYTEMLRGGADFDRHGWLLRSKDEGLDRIQKSA